MPESELISYITEQTQQGVSAELLRQTLMEAGGDEKENANALHDVAAGLEPLTEGISLHEDVSQVRSMVAHLASRMRVVEAALASVGALPMQGQLPNGMIGPDHELPMPRHAWRLGTMTTTIVALGVVFATRTYAYRLIDQNVLAPVDLAIIAAGAGVLLLIAGYIAMRLHRAWVASFFTGSAVAVWALTGWIAWRSYHFIERSTAAALGALLLILALVMGRWIDRLGR